MRRYIMILCLLTAITIAAAGCVIEFDGAAGMISGIIKEHKEVMELDAYTFDGKPVKADLEMKAAKAIVVKSEDKLLDAAFQFNTESLKPEVTMKRDKLQIQNGRLQLGAGKPVNRWNVKLSDQIPLEMNLTAEASDVNMKLGDMSIPEMDAALKASAFRLDFDRPNRMEMERLKLDIKAGSADLYGMGNSRSKRLDIDADASKLYIDLSGQNETDSTLKIGANASAIKLKLPENAGVSIIIDRFDISTVRVENDQLLSRNEKEYISRNYGSAKTHVRIIIDAKMTTVTLE